MVRIKRIPILFETTELLANKKDEFKYMCQCGHYVHIYPFEHIERKICSWCGYYVYKDKEKQKKYDFKRKLKKLLVRGGK